MLALGRDETMQRVYLSLEIRRTERQQRALKRPSPTNDIGLTYDNFRILWPPPEVPSIFRASVDAEGGLGGLTATIYHFGYSAREGRYVGYAYRSDHDFRSDRLQYALGYKPAVSVTPKDDIRFPDFLIDIVLEQQQQRQDWLLPLSERVGIGGEIEFVVMENRTIHSETVHRFSSYDAEAAHIRISAKK